MIKLNKNTNELDESRYYTADGNGIHLSSKAMDAEFARKVLEMADGNVSEIGGSAFSASDRADVEEMIAKKTVKIGRTTRLVSRLIAAQIVANS